MVGFVIKKKKKKPQQTQSYSPATTNPTALPYPPPATTNPTKPYHKFNKT